MMSVFADPHDRLRFSRCASEEPLPMRYRFSLPLRPRCSFTTNIFLDSHWKIVVIEPIEKLDVVSVWDFETFAPPLLQSTSEA